MLFIMPPLLVEHANTIQPIAMAHRVRCSAQYKLDSKTLGSVPWKACTGAYIVAAMMVREANQATVWIPWSRFKLKVKVIMKPGYSLTTTYNWDRQVFVFDKEITKQNASQIWAKMCIWFDVEVQNFHFVADWNHNQLIEVGLERVLTLQTLHQPL